MSCPSVFIFTPTFTTSDDVHIQCELGVGHRLSGTEHTATLHGITEQRDGVYDQAVKVTWPLCVGDLAPKVLDS